MNYKVYLGNKAITLTDVLHNTSKSYLFENVLLDEIIHRLMNGNEKNLLLYSPNIKQAWQKFKQHFDVIEAAGGLVSNDKGEYLFIYRNGIWDLPKGKMEAGEIPAETAIREVQEECGIQNISIDDYLFDTYHLFTENKKKRLKITHWFKMKEGTESPLIPQQEEGIEKVEWINIKENIHILANSYENIRLLFSDILMQK